MIHKKQVIILVLGALLISLLAGCQPAAPATPTSPPIADTPPPAAEPTTPVAQPTEPGEEPMERTTLILWMPGDEARWMIESHLPAMFTEAHPEYDLQVVQLPWDGLHDKFLAGLAGGDLPDVALGADHWVGEFAELGGLMPMEEFKERMGYTDDEFLPNAWDHFIYTDGVMYATPALMEARVLFYRTDLFEAAGLTAAPSTLDEMMEFGKILSDGENQFGVAHQDSWLDFHFYSWLLYAQGGDIYSVENQACLLTEPEGISALEYYKSLYDENVMPKDPVKRVETFSGFKEGYYAMAESGPWWIGLLTQQAPEIEGKWKAALLPSDRTTVAYGHPNPFLVPANANNVAGAEAWIAFFLSPEIQAEWHTISGQLPVTVAAFDDPRLAQNETLMTFRESALRGTNSLRNVPNAEAISETIWNMLSEVRDDIRTPADAAAAACERISALAAGQ